MSINNFDVLKEMSKRNKKIKSFPLDTNLKRVNTGKGGWGEVTVAIDNGTAQEVIVGSGTVGMVLVYDINEFRELAAEMEAAQKDRA